MPRANPQIKDSGIVDQALPDMPPDPAPVAKRGPGRPRGAKTTKPVKMVRDSGGRAMSKAQAKDKVATELYGLASLMVGMWEMRDPECAGPWTEEVNLPGGRQERLAAVVGKVVDILARNDSVLNALATTTMLSEGAVLAGLIWPPVRTVWRHHGPGGMGHQPMQEAEDYARQYPAPEFA